MVCALVGSLATNVCAQGSFRNLDFESAQFVPVPGALDGSVIWSNAMPGWIGYIGGQIQTSIIPDGRPIGSYSPFICINTPRFNTALQGQYDVLFADGTAAGNIIPVALTQTGLVPFQARSLQFLAYTDGSHVVLLGGQQLPIVQLSNGPMFGTALYGADISAFAGKTLELRFQTGVNGDFIDAISFSSSPIPEPSTSALGFIGVAFLFFKRRVKRPARPESFEQAAR
jgi:hypothetical protein